LNTLRSRIITIVIVVVIAAAAYGIGAGHLFTPGVAQAAPVLYNEDTVTSVYNSVSPAVVEIDTTQQTSSFFGQSTGLGSGILIDTHDNKGYILTNDHVVDGATSVKVTLDNGKTATGTIVGTDAIDDLAVVSVDASAVAGIDALQLGDSSMVTPGQMAIAIGNPYGLDDTVTVGIISGVNRDIGGMTGMLQTDAAINPGNSGGPLLDVNGMVIGINTAIETSPSGAVGIGFAIPSNVVSRVLTTLEAGSSVTRPWIGISGVALTDTLAQDLNLSVSSGVYVVSVIPGSPAEAAELKGGNLSVSGAPASGGDVITAVDGNSVATVPDISNYINTKTPGDTITLSILRDGEPMQIQLTLGTWPSNLSPSTPGFNPQPQPAPLPNLPFGPGRHFRQSVPSD
jgi:S1-C subfamily serine protease